ncbi:hypothetical protein B0T20DRAFT_415190 [Sordaria brevicollis]|uniref:Uncharacterized protein n=1 Tax=Sordaria brevicollis TaxID=83679 RepID=A0AAE0PBU5_SORBR|nr:hypothetical protein B0T20DRAFT_415190 [Sordaria brevicollis]
MTSPTSNLGLPDAGIDLHPPASNQRSYQPQPPAESSSPLSQPNLTQTLPPLHLPSSRQFLTSLITAISNIPLFDSEPPPTHSSKPAPTESSAAEAGNIIAEEAKRKQLLQVLKDEGEGQEAKASVKGKANKDPVNPLKLVPPEYRHLIITLHVLFPGVVLPALEVLERGLVERFALRSSLVTPGERAKEERIQEQKEEGDADVTMGEDEDAEDGNRNQMKEPKPNRPPQHHGQQEKRLPECYLVRSSQYINNHFKRKRKKTSMGLDEALDAETTGGEADRERHQIQRYLVSLEAWNCTCAAFAFACVSFDTETEIDSAMVMEQNPEKERDKVGSAGWTFGGMTLFESGDHSSVPPVCKHLLACLLADKWGGALGRYVTERVVSREEMAGVVADI